MAGCKTYVSNTILQKEHTALYTHCYGHALNLAVQDAVKANVILRDTLDTTSIEEMTKRIKKSPRGQVIFEKVNYQKYIGVAFVAIPCRAGCI